MTLDPRPNPLDLPPDEFRRLGHELVERIARHLETLPDRPVTRGESPAAIRTLLGDGPLPETGTDPSAMLSETADMLFEHSLFNGHPRFWGYITSSPAPLGILGDFLASAVNPNVGANILSPVATAIERQAVRWTAELLGFPADCGGIMVSGGNMANMVAFLAARRAKAPWDVRQHGLHGDRRQLIAYASRETHTWIQKAADLFGVGLGAIRWIDTDARQRMRVDALDAAIIADREAGHLPFLVVGTAGSVSTGAIDPLGAIADACRRHDLWFHVDGAYGAPAAVLPEAPDDLKALGVADSVAVDPHKWLYAPLEAGCTLVRNAQHLADAFSFHPVYYHFADADGNEPPLNFHELGMQNSRGFRALKVWLGLRQAGRQGYIQLIRDDIALTRALYDAAAAHVELEALTCDLSIATFRYVPADAKGYEGSTEYLNELNTALLTRLQTGGEAFVSNAVIDGRFALRACLVNFRTRREDIEALPSIVVRLGREVHAEMGAARRATTPA